MDGLDIDMEELESRLYSQVYHSSAENHELPSAQQENQSNTNAQFKRPSRYFRMPAKKPAVSSTPDFIPLSSNQPISMNMDENQRHNIIKKLRYYGGLNEIHPNVVQDLSCNNIVVLPPVPRQFISPNVFPNTHNSFKKYEARRLKNMEKRKRYKQKKLLKKMQAKEESLARGERKVFVEHSLTVKPISLENTESNVIVLSESDNSDIEEIPEKRELIVLSSEDELENVNVKEEKFNNPSTPEPVLNQSIKIEQSPSSSLKSKSDDDVIFVEPEPKHIEVIEIDCDSINTSFKDDEKHSETASTNSEIQRIQNIPQKRIRRELRTPDSSASNDFLDNTVDLNNSRFNFGLHGTDFGTTHSSKTVDMSETDSTTSEVTVPKTNHFNTVDFETPTKQFFEDTNLESFGNYITPSRDKRNIENDNFEQICTKASQRHAVAMGNSSDSSSESDYDEDKVSYLNSKQLPELSAVHQEKDIDIVNADSPIEDNVVVVEETSSEQQLPEKNKRKSEEYDTTNKKRKVDKDDCSDIITTVENNEKVKENESFSSDIDIEKHSDFIIIDETAYDDVSDESDDTDSYFSCDEFNNMTTDLMLGNCQKEQQRHNKAHTGADRQASTRDLDYLNFSVEDVQRTMSDDPNLWKILDIDRLHFRYETPRGPRCHRCREVGHISLNCTKLGPRPCILCGERNHQDPRCPSAMCTSCGRFGGHTTYCSRCANWSKIQCSICKLYGHIDSVCPDMWRRYHLTTKPGPIVKPAKDTFKAEKDRWCSACSKSGHFENICRRTNRSHFASKPEIFNYLDLYNFPKTRPFIIHQEDDTDSKVEEKSLNVVECNEDNIVPDDSFHDAETGSPDKIPLEIEQKKVSQAEAKNMYFDVDFPPSNFIPAYFRKQMNYLRKKYLRCNEKTRGEESNQNSNASDSLDFISLNSKKPTDENINYVKTVDDKIEEPSVKYQRNQSGYAPTLKLNYLQFAYIHTEQGIQFFNSLRRRPGLELILDKYDDLPGGEIYLKSQSEKDIEKVKKEITMFLCDMPCVQDLPEESKQMLDFLQKHKEKLDKAEGNCWTLCKKLCKLSDIGRKDGYNPKTAKLKDNMQVTIQLLLFGKLNHADGRQHVENIQQWINYMRNKPNYTIPLNDIYNIYHSYSYLFHPRKSIFPFKSICAKHDHYVTATNENQKRKKMPLKNRIFYENKRKYVIDICNRHNLPNKFINELKTIQKAMESSKYSRIHYGDFLRFMTRFRNYMKKHRLS